LQTRQWTGADGNQRQATEIVIEDMLVLDSKRQGEEVIAEAGETPVFSEETAVKEESTTEIPAEVPAAETEDAKKSKSKPKSRSKTKTEGGGDKAEEVAEDIPF
jgi:single-stranded DNA-binding protein